MTSHSPASSPELPDLPKLPAAREFYGHDYVGDKIHAGMGFIDEDMEAYATAHGLACYEAGSAAAAQAAKQVPAGYKLVSGHAYGQNYVSLYLLATPSDKIILNAYEQGDPTMFAFLTALAAAPSSLAEAAEAGQAGQVEAAPLTWYDGEPPFPQNQEWFIAETTHGDRVVLMALPDEYSYDYKTADQTYMKAENIKRWMQFPDCEYLPPEAPASPQAPAPSAAPHQGTEGA